MALRPTLFLLALSAPGMLLAGQTPAGQETSAATPARTDPPSAILQASLDMLKNALGVVNVDKWKTSGQIRSDQAENVQSIGRDVQSTLPSLLADSDAAPHSVSKTLPVYRNFQALYDVVLRLDTAARLAAPRDQVSTLDQALAGLSDSARALGNRLQADAEAQDSQVSHLQAQLKAVPPPTPPPAPLECPPPAPVRKKRPVKKPTPPATSTTPASPPK